MRPFEQQSALERTLRAHLWHPVEFLSNYDKKLKSAVKNGRYQEAVDLQTRASRAKLEVCDWENLLELYEAEFATTGAKNEPNKPEVLQLTETK